MTTPVVLITGALTGIGRATALAFAREGARIVISGRHDDEGSAARPQNVGDVARMKPGSDRYGNDAASQACGIEEG